MVLMIVRGVGLDEEIVPQSCSRLGVLVVVAPPRSELNNFGGSGWSPRDPLPVSAYPPTGGMDPSARVPWLSCWGPRGPQSDPLLGPIKGPQKGPQKGVILTPFLTPFLAFLGSSGGPFLGLFGGHFDPQKYPKKGPFFGTFSARVMRDREGVGGLRPLP